MPLGGWVGTCLSVCEARNIFMQKYKNVCTDGFKLRAC